MNTSIQLTTKPSDNEDLLILASSSEHYDTSVFSKSELTYIKTQIKKKVRFIVINQLKRQVILHIVDDKKSEFQTLEAYRIAGNEFVAFQNKSKSASTSLISACESDHILAYAEGVCLGNYQFLRYKSEKNVNSFKTLKIQSKKVSAKDLLTLAFRCDAVCKSRDLVNEPLNGLNATGLSNEFRKMGKEAGFKVTVLDKKKIQALKMGGLLAVNLGSIDPPTFTIMEYRSPKAGKGKPIVLVGKGVVYDTGGLSLKPTPNSMDYMKSDMAGAAAVGGIMYAIAKMKLPCHVIGLVPATDNRPDGNAYTPGDVIKMYNGSTVEVLNTDAEGRMILADALHYAAKYKPEVVFEFSTLTGAAANAIGKYGIVCMGDVSDNLKKELISAGNKVYERLVEFPYWDEYDELLKSDIADMKNIGGPIGGAITAGRFLSKFTNYPYMHFDIAGPAYGKSSDSYRNKNASGVGVRLICEFLQNH